MSLRVKYDDVVNLPTTSDRGLIITDLNQFTEHDYCVTVTVKPDLQANKENRKEEEPLTHCIWGRAGKHMGVFIDFNAMRYTFGWWEGDEYKFLLSDIEQVVEDYTTISVVKNSGSKTFKLYINGDLQDEKEYGELHSYVHMPITLGIGNEQPEAFPHQNKFEGDYSKFVINNTHKLDEGLNANTMVYLDFEPDNLTYYSIHDISNNGNRARINHSSYKRTWEKIEV